MTWNFDTKPILVFWETTKACDLACHHCRAEAIPQSLPGELSTQEGKALIDQIEAFGRPYPILILTGGDPLKRIDLFELIAYARAKGIQVSVAPSATPLLNPEVLLKMADYGVDGISLSLDGATVQSHDDLRGVSGTFTRTLAMAQFAVNAGLKVQINTTVMDHNVEELPAIFEVVKSIPAQVWEVFFLIQTGRGSQLNELSPNVSESVCHFLYQAAHYGVTVRTVEGPYFRRIVRQYEEQISAKLDLLTQQLNKDLLARLGSPTHSPLARSVGTRDGKGIVFISYRGDVSPSGFLPMVADNLSNQNLQQIYAHNPLFVELRDTTSFKGRCGVCEYAHICGGSRARAYARTDDVMEEDPNCVYELESVRL